MFKKLLAYLGCVAVATAGCTGIVVGNYAINKNKSVTSSISTSQTINKELEIAIENIKDADNLVAQVEVDLSMNNISISVDGQLQVEIENNVELDFVGNIEIGTNNIPIAIRYINNKIYINSNKISVYLKTDNLLKDLNGILKTIGMDFLDLENLTMDNILGFLGNCETIPQENGNLLYLNLMDIIAINLNLDENNMLYNVNIPSSNIEGISIGANIDITYNQNGLDVKEPENLNEYKDITNFLDYVSKLVNLLEGKLLSGNILLSISEINLSLDFVLDFNDSLNIYITGELLGKQLNINIENSNCYISFGEIKLKATLDELIEMINGLFKDFNLGELLSQLLSGLKNLELTEIECNKKDFLLEINNKIKISGKLNKDTFSNIILNFNEISAEIDFEKNVVYQEINQEEFISIGTYLGAIDMEGVGKILNTGLNYFKQDSMCASIILGNNQFSTMLELQINKNSNEFTSMIIGGEILENEFYLIYDFMDQYFYISFAQLKVKCNSKELADNINKLLINFDIDLTPILSLLNLTEDKDYNKIFKLLDNPAISELLSDILDKLVIDKSGHIRLDSELIKLNGNVKNEKLRLIANTNFLNNLYLMLDLGISTDELVYCNNLKNILENEKYEYIDISEFTQVIDGISSIISNKNLCGRIGLQLSDINITFDYVIDLNNTFTMQLYGKVLDQLMLITIDETAIYLSYGKLNIKANLENIKEFVIKIIKYFNLEKDLSELLNVSLENTLMDLLTKLKLNQISANMIEISIDELKCWLISEVNSSEINIIYNSLKIDLSLNHYKTQIIEINKNNYENIFDKLDNISIEDYNKFLNIMSEFLDGKKFNFNINANVGNTKVDLDINFAFENDNINKLVVIGTINENVINLVYIPNSDATNSYFYLTINNLKLKFNLSSLGNIVSIVADLLGLDVKEINQLFNINLQTIETEVFKVLLDNFNINELNIEKILQEIHLTDGVLSVKILDMFKLSVITSNINNKFNIDKILINEFNLFGTDINFEMKLNTSNVKIPSTSGNYIDVSKISDFVEMGVNLLNKKQIKLQGQIDINLGKLSLINLDIFGRIDLKEVIKNGKKSYDIIMAIVIDNLPTSCFMMDEINGITYNNHRVLITYQNGNLNFTRSADKVIGATLFGKEIYSYRGITKNLKTGSYKLSKLLSGELDILQMLQDMVGYKDFVDEIITKVMENGKCPSDYSIDKIIDNSKGFIYVNNYYEINLNGAYLFKNELFGNISLGITRNDNSISNLNLNVILANGLVNIKSNNLSIGNITGNIRDNKGNYISANNYLSNIINNM